MQRSLTFSIIFCILINTIVAQDAPALQWVASEYVKAMNVKGPKIEKDAEGNIFTISTQVHLNPLVGFILIKYDPEGNKLWERNYEGLLPHLYYGPAIDPDGNVYVSINYGGLPGLPTYTILLKYAPDGELLWEKSFEDWANNVTNLLSTGPSGLLYFSGGVSNTNITQGYYMGCMDTSDGSILWKVEQVGQINPYNMKLLEDKIILFANGLAVNGSNTRYHVIQQFSYGGDILAINQIEDTGFYSPDFNQITEEGDVLIGNRWGGFLATKISLVGEILWNFNKSITQNGSVYGLVSDDSQNTYITGGFGVNGEWSNFLTMKISPEGEQLWESYYYSGTDSLGGGGYDIMIDSNYVYVAGGSSKESIDLKSATVILILDKKTGEVIFDTVVMTDTTEWAEDLILLEEGFAYCGESHDMTPNTVNLLTGYYKFSHPVPTKEPREKTDPFLLFPNPASDVVYVQQSKRASVKNVAEVFDMNGRLMMMMPFMVSEKIKLDVGHLPSGMYVMKVGNQALKFNITK